MHVAALRAGLSPLMGAGTALVAAKTSSAAGDSGNRRARP